MKGLIRNNFYASLSNIKLFSIIILLLGVFVAAMDNKIPTLLINYTLISMCGFSFNAVSSIGKENTAKWGKYKLTFPVTRAAIVKSYYVNHIIWCLTGLAFALVCSGCSILLHGFPVLDATDFLMMYTASFGISLLLGAIFFPMYFLAGEERREAVVIISMLFAILLLLGFITLINHFFAPLGAFQLIAAALLLTLVSLCIFVLSFPLAVYIFMRKEY